MVSGRVPGIQTACLSGAGTVRSYTSSAESLPFLRILVAVVPHRLYVCVFSLVVRISRLRYRSGLSGRVWFLCSLSFVSLEDLSALLLCEASFLEHRVLSFIRPALVIPAVDAQQAHPNRHVPPEFHRLFTAFPNRHGLNGGIEEEETESDDLVTPSVSFSPSKSSPSSSSSSGFQSSSPPANPGENRPGTPEGGSLSARAARGSGHESGRILSGAKGSTKRLFSLLDLKELLTVRSVVSFFFGNAQSADHGRPCIVRHRSMTTQHCCVQVCPDSGRAPLREKCKHPGSANYLAFRNCLTMDSVSE